MVGRAVGDHVSPYRKYYLAHRFYRGATAEAEKQFWSELVAKYRTSFNYGNYDPRDIFPS